MAELPRGTVTLVFTDIEGSTRLLASLGPHYEQVLADHRKLLRAAFSSHQGIEVDTQGDAFFYAFSKAHDAVTAAVEAQRALSSNDFGEGVEVRVRMGIHSGAPTVSREGYVGPDVHLGARVSAAAWGSQIVVSSATAGLLSSGPKDITLRSLGEHALKDIAQRTELFQVMAPGLTEDFPALRAKGTHPTNLPARLASLIGREQDLAALKELLESPETSVVTLVGPGGTGKTSLAAALGAQLLSSYPDGVFFVDLSALSDPSLVIPALAQTLALKETPARTLQESLAEHLSARKMLVVLDNFEQVIGAAPEVSSVLAEAPSLKLVVTSREALRIQGERVVSLAPLELPSPKHDDVDEVARSAAVALFTERARAVNEDFTLTQDNAAEVAAICRRLDGLPLALELAAARVNVLSPSSLLARLDQGLKVLTSGRRDAAQRQRTLRGAIAWSYGLLSQDEQRLLYRLGVFAGGWSLQAAEQVCDRGDLTTDVLDGLASLVDKSLVRTAGAQERFTMLETIREFALEMHEESGEVEETRRAHAEFFRTLAEEAEPHHVGPDQQEWLDRLDREHDNLRAALTWAFLKNIDCALDITASARRLWWVRGYLSEGHMWLTKALSAAPQGSVVRVRILRGLTAVVQMQGDNNLAAALADEGLQLTRSLGDEEGTASFLTTLGIVAEERRDYEAAVIARTCGSTSTLATAVNNLGSIALQRDHLERADKLFRESLEMELQQNDEEGQALALLNLGLVALKRGTAHTARPLLVESLVRSYRLGHSDFIVSNLETLAAVAASQRHPEMAAELLGLSEALQFAIGLSLPASERQLREQTFEEIELLLDEATLSRAFDKGRRSRIEDVIRRFTNGEASSMPSPETKGTPG